MLPERHLQPLHGQGPLNPRRLEFRRQVRLRFTISLDDHEEHSVEHQTFHHRRKQQTSSHSQAKPLHQLLLLRGPNCHSYTLSSASSLAKCVTSRREKAERTAMIVEAIKNELQITTKEISPVQLSGHRRSVLGSDLASAKLVYSVTTAASLPMSNPEGKVEEKKKTKTKKKLRKHNVLSIIYSAAAEKVRRRPRTRMPNEKHEQMGRNYQTLPRGEATETEMYHTTATFRDDGKAEDCCGM